MSLPVWRLTQIRSQPGGSKWCAFVLEGRHPSLDTKRPLLPVVRATGWAAARAVEIYEITRDDVPELYHWLDAPMRWQKLLASGDLVTAREHTGSIYGGSVGRYFGVFEIEEYLADLERLRIVFGRNVAEVTE